MEFVEKHLNKIIKILNTESGLYNRLEQTAKYLVEYSELSSLSIFRRAGDELDDGIVITDRQQQVASFAPYRIHILSANINKRVTVVPSRHTKERSVKVAFKSRPEFTIPIKSRDNVVGFIHAEKNAGEFFAPIEVRLLKECAKEMGQYFENTVFKFVPEQEI